MQKNFGIKYGLIAGLLSILYIFLFYTMDREMMLGHWVYRSTTLIYLTLMFMAAFALRKADGGFIELKTALRVAFQTFLVANVVFYVFYYLLFNFYDPDLVILQKEMMDEHLASLDPKENKAILESMKDADFSFTFSKAFFSFATDAIMGFILSLVIAGITRNK